MFGGEWISRLFDVALLFAFVWRHPDRDLTAHWDILDSSSSSVSGWEVNRFLGDLNQFELQLGIQFAVIPRKTTAIDVRGHNSWYFATLTQNGRQHGSRGQHRFDTGPGEAG